jgi:hypothetical protein
LARTKRCFLLISQLLSHHVLSWYHADNCQAVKINGRCATLRQDSKACKGKSKIQCRGIKKEMGWPWKVKGHLPSYNPAAALPGYVE